MKIAATFLITFLITFLEARLEGSKGVAQF